MDIDWEEGSSKTGLAGVSSSTVVLSNALWIANAKTNKSPA